MQNQLVQVESVEALRRLTTENGSFLPVLFVNDTSQRSAEALALFKNLVTEKDDRAVAVVNVSRVRDIHETYRVRSVPTVITLKNGSLQKMLEGLQTEETYRRLLSDAPRKTVDGRELPPLRVTVYTTRSCPHCTTVKNHLRRKGIPFREVDVGRDPTAASELTRRTGQTGVPQTDINGAFVLGADLPKINRLTGVG